MSFKSSLVIGAVLSASCLANPEKVMPPPISAPASAPVKEAPKSEPTAEALPPKKEFDPAHPCAHVEQDIRTALRISREINLPRTLIVNPVEAHRVAELLAESQGAIVGPFYQLPRRLIEGIEGEDFRAATPQLLAAAGVPLAIGSGPDDPAGSLRDRAILAMRAGLSAPLALAAITGTPASLLGLSDVGDLSVGKAGDLVILDGPPLAPTSRVLAVVIDGRIAWTDPGAPAAIVSLRSSPPPLPPTSPSPTSPHRASGRPEPAR